MVEKFAAPRAQNVIGVVLVAIVCIIRKMRQMVENNRLIGIDLCAGVGGMSLGFQQAGFDIVAVVDIDPIHMATYARNFPNTIRILNDLAVVTGKDIRKIANLNGNEIDVLFGGPPCGGFSMIGKRRVEDPRNQLLLHFARLIRELKPKYFVVENVKGLLVKPMDSLVDLFIENVNRAGYNTVAPIQVLNANDFGVPQRRQRVFILGYRQDVTTPTYPMPFNSDLPKPTIWDAIGDLPNIDQIDELIDNDVYTGELLPTKNTYARILRGQIRDPHDFSPVRSQSSSGISGCRRTKHRESTIRCFELTKPGSVEPKSRLYRLTKDGMSPTLRAGTGKDFGSYSAPRPIHPIYHRCISVREGARLHSFPDWFQFHETKWYGFRQIGNAVPPLLAREVANSIIVALNN
jgi:DNA (cytosine-5)-methyltransferase 1